MYKILALTSLIALTNAQARGDPAAPADPNAPAAAVAGNLGGNPTIGGAPAPTPAPGPAPVPGPAPAPAPGPAPITPPGPPPVVNPPAPPAPAPAPHNQASNGDVVDLNKHDITLDYQNKKIEHLDIDSSEDAHTQPMCAIGGQQSHADLEMPTDYCCRIYELQDFYGRYYDLCYRKPLSSGDHDIFTLSKFGWHEEVSSWKCGAKVEMMMCEKNITQVGECPVGHSESGGRNSQNSRTHFDNSINYVKIDLARTKFSATIYEYTGCSGKSQLLKGGDLREGSWDNYKGTPHHSLLLTAGTVNSVFLDELTDISFYKVADFLSDQWTVRNDSATSPKCIDLNGDLNPFGPVGINWYNGLHSAWVHKNWFPNGDAKPAPSWSVTP